LAFVIITSVDLSIARFLRSLFPLLLDR
jgi:hypothetical protein